MIPLTVTPNIEAAPWTDTRDLTELGTIVRIGRLPRGTVRGKSTVSVLIEFEDGRRVVAQTTLALLRTALIGLIASAEREGEFVE